MTRSLTVVALFAFAPATRAQDMPLAQILIPGEGWKKVEGATRPKPAAPTVLGGDAAPWKTAVVRSADGSTVYVGFSKGQFLHAHALTKDGALDQGHPYAPLRLKTGTKDIAVSGLAADRDGRIYAATEIGVQVFDPTGRMCGVLTPAAAGTPEALAFEGDQLTLWVGDTKYTRTLRTAGARP
ncbi:hypothetical protein [Gemmata sp.]|uniref:hypothetical protein n=1 Tax=Gemmata sp. TaxID=1914242 RepID=UPI003F72617B